MKLLLLVVGRTVDKHLSALIDDYAGRIKHYVPFEMEVIPELKNAKSLSFEQQKEREGELLLRSLKEGDAVWLLDEGGREFRSIELASFLDRQHSSGARVWSLSLAAPTGSLPLSMHAPTARFLSRVSPSLTRWCACFSPNNSTEP